MEQLNPHSILVTGSNRGLGLEFIRQLVMKINPPKWIFVTCRDPAGPRAQVFLPLLRKAAQESPLEGMSCSKAAIVNISSEAGSITNVLEWQRSYSIAYRCSKSAVNMLSKCQSLHLAKDEILCVALHSGWVVTDMGNKAGKAPLTMEQSLHGILNTLGCLSEKNTGTFLNWEGNLVPW